MTPVPVIIVPDSVPSDESALEIVLLKTDVLLSSHSHQHMDACDPLDGFPLLTEEPVDVRELDEHGADEGELGEEFEVDEVEVEEVEVEEVEVEE